MKQMVILLFAILMMGCGEKKEEPEINLEDYNHSEAIDTSEVSSDFVNTPDSLSTTATDSTNTAGDSTNIEDTSAAQTTGEGNE